mgnify:CR=1 FL=1
MKFWFCLGLFCCSFASHGVVKRHDVPPKHYLVKSAPEYLINMPHEGHGVLINSQWVVTVAHTIFYDYVGKSLTIGTKSYEITQVYLHPKYSKPASNLLQGDLAPLMDFLKSRSDIALIKLATPVSGVTPVAIYGGSDEQGKTITVFGKGATGNGINGEDLSTKSHHVMHQFQNVVNSAQGNWLSFTFDEPNNALPLEGMHGSGDSGGAAIVHENGRPLLIGLSSWQLATGDIAAFKGGLYGTTAYQVRLSSYRDWINAVMGTAHVN